MNIYVVKAPLCPADRGSRSTTLFLESPEGNQMLSSNTGLILAHICYPLLKDRPLAVRREDKGLDYPPRSEHLMDCAELT